MTDGTRPSSARKGRHRKKWRGQGASKSSNKAGTLYGAVDLGTNNCRLLVAVPAKDGFRVIDSYSQIVRLGEGLSSTGRLSEAAMDRAMQALSMCAQKLQRHRVRRIRCVATQACRTASNGAEFLATVRQQTELRMQTISTDQEARLAVRGCEDLLDTKCDAALVIDIGGGSTELSWIDFPANGASRDERHEVKASISIPMGVVNMAERFPEEGDRNIWFEAMRSYARDQITAYEGAAAFAPVFAQGQVHYVGTSGAVTSLGGVHLNLSRYIRSKVDGMWLSRDDTDAATARLLGKTLDERAQEPCIGAERADLVLAGCAILAGIQDVWPAPRIRVADRGLREGLLLGMISADQRSARRRGMSKRTNGSQAQGNTNGG